MAAITSEWNQDPPGYGYRSLADFHKGAPHANPSHHFFDTFEPEWACPDDEMLPADGYGDGHKWMCGMRLAPPPRGQCLIYSLGSAGDDKWEKAMAQRLPGCEIHIFDPSLGEAASRDMQARARAYGATFHAFGITGDAKNVHKSDSGVARLHSWEMKTMGQAVHLLGHVGRRISYLKVDIEGSEWGVFLGTDLSGSKSGLFRSCSGGGKEGALVGIDQLTIELHSGSPNIGDPFVINARWFAAAEACGLRIFHKEPNGWGCLGNGCIEYSLVHDNVVKRIVEAM